MPQTANSLIARYPLIALVLLPLLTLAALVIASAAAEIALDHFVLGRGPDGMPVLSNLPLALSAIAAWNLALIYILPPALIVLICAMGRKHGVPQLWIAIGAGLIAIVGSLHNIHAVWTGVSGTSQLVIGLESHWITALVRLVLNLFVLFLGIGPIERRRAPS